MITDTHIQTDYKYGAATECDDPASCCFEIDIFNKSEKAGYWGSKA